MWHVNRIAKNIFIFLAAGTGMPPFQNPPKRTEPLDPTVVFIPTNSDMKISLVPEENYS